VWTGVRWFRIAFSQGVHENSNSHSGSIKGEEFFDQMSDYQLSKFIGPWIHSSRLYLKCKHDPAYSGEIIMITMERRVNAADRGGKCSK
jgi:hypothetical protein